MDFIDPKQFGLNSRTKLATLNKHIAIIVDRKSRIIMKDGRRIFDQAVAIRKKEKRPVVLLTSAPVCGKTKIFLSENDIAIQPIS